MSNYQGNFTPGKKNSNWNMAFDLISEKTRVLDIGCSNGNFGEALIYFKGCVVEGVEPDIEDAKKASQKLSKVHTRTIEEVIDSIDEKDKYDHIVLLDVIEHLQYPIDILSKLKRVLKPNGTVIFSIPNMAHQAVRIMLLGGRFEYGKTGILDNTHLHFYTVEEINRVFIDAGYSIFDLKGVSVMYDEETLKSELREIGISKPSSDLIQVLESNNAHIYQYIGAARISSSKVITKIRRQFQSPQAKNIINESHKKKIAEMEKKIADCNKNSINLSNEIKAIKASKTWKIATKIQKISSYNKRLLQKSNREKNE